MFLIYLSFFDSAFIFRHIFQQLRQFINEFLSRCFFSVTVVLLLSHKCFVFFILHSNQHFPIVFFKLLFWLQFANVKPLKWIDLCVSAVSCFTYWPPQRNLHLDLAHHIGQGISVSISMYIFLPLFFFHSVVLVNKIIFISGFQTIRWLVPSSETCLNAF